MEKNMADRLLKWYDRHGRTLPFRGTKNPYRIWVSEIMLQQTRTETVGVYFMNFLERFPDVFALAAAREQDVLKMWEGLGYYSRARNLHKAAQMAVREWNGVFPADYEKLLSLPGVGEYTAAAIASIAFDLPRPAMDGNLTRVFSRLHGVREDVAIPSVKRKLADIAGREMPRQRCGDFNQALMDLGATVCTPGTPDCDRCPLKGLCDAYREGDADMLPVKAAQKAPKKVDMAVLLISCQGHILMKKRTEALLKNMWVYPLAEDTENEEQVKQAVKKMGLEPVDTIKLCDARHVFTHRIWQMQIWHCPVRLENKTVAGQWFSLSEMAALPIPTAVKAARQEAVRIILEKMQFVRLNSKRFSNYQPTAYAYWESWMQVNKDKGSPQFVKEHTPTYMEMVLRGHASAGRDVYSLQVGDKVVGVMVLDEAANEICTLYVQPDVQKMGIGTRAVQFALSHLDGTRDMHVTALDHVPHALRMYKKAGFVQVKDHRLLNKTYDVWETALVRPAGDKR